jgi:hypothetical protein
LYLWCEHFYRLPPSPLRYSESWNRRKETLD